eukprot:1680864-Rhodomonas_salina.1
MHLQQSLRHLNRARLSDASGTHAFQPQVAQDHLDAARLGVAQNGAFAKGKRPAVTPGHVEAAREGQSTESQRVIDKVVGVDEKLVHVVHLQPGAVRCWPPEDLRGQWHEENILGGLCPRSERAGRTSCDSGSEQAASLHEMTEQVYGEGWWSCSGRRRQGLGGRASRV